MAKKKYMSGHGVRFRINPNLCLKDPQMTEYGQKVLANSILLFDELGFENLPLRNLQSL